MTVTALHFSAMCIQSIHKSQRAVLLTQHCTLRLVYILFLLLFYGDSSLCSIITNIFFIVILHLFVFVAYFWYILTKIKFHISIQKE